jgi:hypothetical protein
MARSLDVHKFNMVVAKLVGLCFSCLSFAASPLYPEEEFRKKWDRGCADWQPVAPYIAGISVNTQRSGGVFRIIAAARLKIAPGQNAEGSLVAAQRILADGLDYPLWVMPGINHDPFGNPYFVSIDSATASNYRSSSEYAIQGTFSLGILWVKREGKTSIIFRTETTPLPNCAEAFDLSNAQVGSRVTYRMIPRPGVLDYMIGEAYVSRGPDGSVDLKLRAVIKPANALYQVIPEKLIQTQVDQRARKIFENFVKRHAELLAKKQH